MFQFTSSTSKLLFCKVRLTDVVRWGALVMTLAMLFCLNKLYYLLFNNVPISAAGMLSVPHIADFLVFNFNCILQSIWIHICRTDCKSLQQQFCTLLIKWHWRNDGQRTDISSELTRNVHAMATSFVFSTPPCSWKLVPVYTSTTNWSAKSGLRSGTKLTSSLTSGTCCVRWFPTLLISTGSGPI